MRPVSILWPRFRYPSRYQLDDSRTKAAGAFAAIGAFSLWGVLPVYYNLIGSGVSAWEVLLHRVIWSAALLMVVAVMAGRVDRLLALRQRPQALLALAASALVITVNWAIFIWAVTSGHILDSSLGYYINPLLNVLLGFLFLGERLRRLQLLAVVIAAAGVVVAVVAYGHVPWIALLLASFFGVYGLIRKQVEVDSAIGLLAETLMIMPFALIALGWMYVQGSAHGFVNADWRNDLLMVGNGLVTVVPLVLFGYAARRLRLGTLGLIQYIAPTGHLLLAVYLYGEPFTAADSITFACIWIGLGLYSVDLWRAQRPQSGLLTEVAPQAPDRTKL